eukprot:SAG11_NODE_6963_length_1218_cov_1.490617_1_plen_276_part_00
MAISALRSNVATFVGVLALQARCVAACNGIQLYELDNIVQSCCEAASDPFCAQGFPVTCTHSCAELIVPFYDECGEMVQMVGQAGFDHVDIARLADFVEPCRQTLVLANRAGGDAAVCIGELLQQRVANINSACCELNGANICTGGAPDRCDAECAMVFVPYFDQCIDGRSAADPAMLPFVQLHDSCTLMPPEEVQLLYNDIILKIMEPACTIDTATIRSLHDSKAGPPPCDTDTIASSLCRQMLASSVSTCKDGALTTIPNRISRAALPAVEQW